MISHSEKFIFLHIPKTGGTSVEYMLRDFGTVLQGPKNFDSIYYKHATAESIKRTLKREYNKYFKFTFIRNPWDWVVSNFAFNRGLGRPYVIGTGYALSSSVPSWAKHMSFPDWLIWWIETFNPSQSAVFTGADGESLVDVIFRFESLVSDFNRLVGMLGVRSRTSEFPHLKRSDRMRDYESYYDHSSRQLVREHFARDLQYWDATKP